METALREEFRLLSEILRDISETLKKINSNLWCLEQDLRNPKGIEEPRERQHTSRY